jgi:large subunit ribosomal protein L19
MDMASVIDLKPNANVPELNPGDSVKVNVKVVEGDKERIQVFQGVVIRIKHNADGTVVTVRRVSYGVGVERTFLVNSPRVEKIEVVRRGKARRARLYYLRGLSAKASRIKERREVEEEKVAEIKPAAEAPSAATPE